MFDRFDAECRARAAIAGQSRLPGAPLEPLALLRAASPPPPCASCEVEETRPGDDCWPARPSCDAAPSSLPAASRGNGPWGECGRAGSVLPEGFGNAQDPATQRVPVCGSGVRDVSNRGKFDKGVGGSWQKCVNTRPW